MPVTPRDAATVILARPTPDGAYDTLFTLRPESMKFMGGMYVFPGGAVDGADASDALAARSALSRDDAAERLGESIPPERALALFVCALRELFEEVGVLIARDADGSPVDPGRVRDVYAPHQAELGHDPTTFAHFLEREGLILATDLVVPHGRLVTPEMSPIRFDARFFVAPLPEGQTLVPDVVEVTDCLWMRPRDAMIAGGEETVPIAIPTMAILAGLAELPSYEQVLMGGFRRREIESTVHSPLVLSVLAPNPGLMTGPGTNTYIVGTGDVAIIDPAVPDPIYIERIAREAGDRGWPARVLLTHLHPDHIGGVVALSEMGCEVGVWEGAVDQAPGKAHGIADGEKIVLGDATLIALHTPGHASHHLCFVLEQEQAIFAGDVVAGVGTVVIGPPDGNMAQYLDTLHRLRELNPKRIYPGHGPVIEDGVAKLDEYIAHRADRERQVVGALREGAAEIPVIVKRVYTDVPESLHPVAEMSVLAVLEKLDQEGRVTRSDDTWSLNR